MAPISCHIVNLIRNTYLYYTSISQEGFSSFGYKTELWRITIPTLMYLSFMDDWCQVMWKNWSAMSNKVLVESCCGDAFLSAGSEVLEWLDGAANREILKENLLEAFLCVTLAYSKSELKRYSSREGWIPAFSRILKTLDSQIRSRNIVLVCHVKWGKKYCAASNFASSSFSL